MFLCGWLALVTLIPVILSTNPGVEIKVTDKGLEYGRQLGMAAIHEKLKGIRVPDYSGSQRVSPIGKVKYSLSNIQLVSVGLPTSSVTLVPGTGIRLSISNAFISLHGNWRVKYLRFIKDSGSFNLNVNEISIATTLATKSDTTGHPEVSSIDCAASVGSAKVKFRGGASWLYNLFSKYIDRALRNAMQKQICPLVTNAMSDLNPRLKTLNVLARVDQYSEIEYSLVSAPTVSNSSINIKLKGQFYNIGKHEEPPFSAPAFSLPPQNDSMLYIGLSAFTANSAAFVYDKAGVMSMYITDDMIPKGSPLRLTTRTFGTFIPQIAKRFPGLMVKLLVKTVNAPTVTFEANKATVQATAAMTAYAIQPNATLTPLFILNLDTSISAQVSINGLRLVGSLALNNMNLNLVTSYVGDFQVRPLSNILQLVFKWVVIPVVNVQLAKGYPLPALGNMELLNTQLHVMKDYIMIGTDVNFTG